MIFPILDKLHMGERSGSKIIPNKLSDTKQLSKTFYISKKHWHTCEISDAISAKKNNIGLVWAAFTLLSSSGKFRLSPSPRPIKWRLQVHGGISIFFRTLHHRLNAEPNFPIRIFPVSFAPRTTPSKHCSFRPGSWKRFIGWDLVT